jgi:biopolymer transport protein ExbB/TolQ
MRNKSSSSCISNYIAIAFLPTIFFIGIVLGFLGVIALKVELHSLVIIAFIYIIFLFFIKHNANYVICKMRNESIELQKSLQKAIYDNSLTIGDKTKSTINIEDFVNEYYKSFRNDNFATVASSLFPMLGILGTFTAIAISMPDFSITDTDTLDKQISILLSGIGTAFYASIFGIFLSIVWIYFEKRGLSKFDSDKLYLESLYKDYIWSDSELKKHEHIQYNLRDERLVSLLKETFSLEFIEKLNDRHMENFKTVMEQTNKNFTNVSTHLKLVLEELKETISTANRAQNALEANDRIEKNIQKFISVADKLQNSLDRFEKIRYRL